MLKQFGPALVLMGVLGSGILALNVPRVEAGCKTTLRISCGYQYKGPQGQPYGNNRYHDIKYCKDTWGKCKPCESDMNWKNNSHMCNKCRDMAPDPAGYELIYYYFTISNTESWVRLRERVPCMETRD